MSDDRIRAALPADVPAILRLLRGLAEYERMSHEATATEAQLHKTLFGPLPRAQAIVADIDGETVGLALFYFTLSSFKLQSNIFLEDLFVDPAYRGSGLGVALMRHLAQRAVAEKCARIEWRVLNWNQPSIDFYHRLGAQPIQLWHTLLLDGDALAALAEGTSDG
jgi:GNAT superfamily N-acetyltransferase